MNITDFDTDRLSAWLTLEIADFSGPLTVKRFAGGQSNPTYRLETPGRNYVLRKKPSGKLLKGAHAVEREARVISALTDAGVPVPRVHAVCEDGAIIGTNFFVMEMVEAPVNRSPNDRNEGA